MAETLRMFAIYRHPLDHPDRYAVREWLVMSNADGGGSAAGALWLADDLDGARALVPEGLTRMERDRDDDPYIVETWV